MHEQKLWINDVRCNGFRVVCTNEAGELFTYKYFSTKDNDDAEAMAMAVVKDLRKQKTPATVEESRIVLGNIDGLDRELGSLRVPLELFVDENGEEIEPETHQLFSFSAKDIYFSVDKETQERSSKYLAAEEFVLGKLEDTASTQRVSIFG